MGVLLEGDGDFDIQIEFVPQRWHDVGLVLSGLTLILAAGYVVCPAARRFAQFGRRARQTTDVP
jgi:hypothetical protein